MMGKDTLSSRDLPAHSELAPTRGGIRRGNRGLGASPASAFRDELSQLEEDFSVERSYVSM